MVSPEQLKYIKSQVRLYGAVYEQVKEDDLLGTLPQSKLVDVANAIYQGYGLSDIEDKLSAIQMDIEKMV